MVCDVMTEKKVEEKEYFKKLGKYSTEKLKDNSFDITTVFPFEKK